MFSLYIQISCPVAAHLCDFLVSQDLPPYGEMEQEVTFHQSPWFSYIKGSSKNYQLKLDLGIIHMLMFYFLIVSGHTESAICENKAIKFNRLILRLEELTFFVNFSLGHSLLLEKLGTS